METNATKIDPNTLIASFKDRTKMHIDLVNKYAHMLGIEFPDHDCDKFNPDVIGGYVYSICSKEQKDLLTKEQIDAYNNATLLHITTNKHHPEYWNGSMITDFDRANPPQGIDATSMSKIAMLEMCCDWCAMSEELGNTPFEWFDKVNGTRWLFSTEQIDFISSTLQMLWPEGRINA